MYYSYYKTIAESKDFFDGMEKLSRDNLSEYGNVIDASRKYSLLPEVTISFLSQLFENLNIRELSHNFLFIL